MFVGHFAVGLYAKRVEPVISLGTFFLAAMLADLLWCLFLIAGIEHVNFAPGKGAANYFMASNICWSHSLLMDAVWGGLLALGYFLRRRWPRGAWLLWAVVLSHWVLDGISHRPDMPLAPGLHKYFGLGLWTSIPAALLIEGGFWTIAVILYARATRPRGRMGVYAFWIVIVLLTLAWYSNLTGPPPQNPRLAPIVSFVFFCLAVGWGYWIDRLRGFKRDDARALAPS